MKKRYIIYLCLIGLLALSIFPVLTPILPVIQLPGETLGLKGAPILGSLGLTNTFVASLVTFVIILLITFSVGARSRTADEVPTGFYNFMEMLIEMAYNYVVDAAGKWTKVFFPFFMTFILWIVIGNWLELVPGVDSIGLLHEVHAHHGDDHGGDSHADDSHGDDAHAGDDTHAADDGHSKEATGAAVKGLFIVTPTEEDIANDNAKWTITPFLRAPATDLNFTLALAIISVVMTQYYGMKAQGLAYWKKFFVWDGDGIAKSPLKVIDTGVGLLEFISEVFKIVSFAFRLLGNIFAGQVLLFVIGSLVPVANLLFWHLEFGIGLLQGVVFALLTLTFMKGATEHAHH